MRDLINTILIGIGVLFLALFMMMGVGLLTVRADPLTVKEWWHWIFIIPTLIMLVFAIGSWIKK